MPGLIWLKEDTMRLALAVVQEQGHYRHVTTDIGKLLAYVSPAGVAVAVHTALRVERILHAVGVQQTTARDIKEAIAHEYRDSLLRLR